MEKSIINENIGRSTGNLLLIYGSLAVPVEAFAVAMNIKRACLHKMDFVNMSRSVLGGNILWL